MLVITSSSCAVLHHAQVGQIDNRNSSQAVPFEILLSETGVSVEEAGKIARATNSSMGRDAGNVAAIIGLFQMGPRTGNPIYSPRFAEKLIYQIHERCPSGRVTGLVSIREMRKYPVVSGEIVKVTGFCLNQRAPASANDSSNDADGEI